MGVGMGVCLFSLGAMVQYLLTKFTENFTDNVTTENKKNQLSLNVILFYLLDLGFRKMASYCMESYKTWIFFLFH